MFDKDGNEPASDIRDIFQAKLDSGKNRPKAVLFSDGAVWPDLGEGSEVGQRGPGMGTGTHHRFLSLLVSFSRGDLCTPSQNPIHQLRAGSSSTP